MAITAGEKQARVEQIARRVASFYEETPLDISSFIEVAYVDSGVEKTGWVYPRPLETSEGTVVQLDLGEQLALLSEVREDLGVALAHGSLGLHLAAYHDPNCRVYKENVLSRQWIYTGEVGRKNPDGTFDVRRAVGAKFVDREVSSVQPDLSQPALQSSVALLSGYFSSLKYSLPVDEEISEKRLGAKGHWYGLKEDWRLEDGVFAVRCYSRSVGRVLGAVTRRPSGRDSGGALPIATFVNPKR